MNAHNLAFECVPELYVGKFDLTTAKALSTGKSVYSDIQPVKEGVVIKSLKDQMCYMGRKVLKLINDDYLLDRSNTDNH